MDSTPLTGLFWEGKLDRHKMAFL